MRKRLTALLLLAAAAVTLCGCGSFFDKEYVVETRYEPPAKLSVAAPDDAAVASFDELQDVLRSMVTEGDQSRLLRFDPVYAGDVSADLANACWQVRTQDALCAYCVENISYELTRLLGRYEALLSVNYGKTEAERDSIVHLPYAAEAAEVLYDAMEAGQRSLVLLIERSSYTAEGMEDLVLDTYRRDPAISPLEPTVLVDMISGADTQRLYVLELDYGLPEAERVARRDEIAALDLLLGTDVSGLSEAERALLACSALIVRSRYTADPAKNSLYDALIGREADSRGFALAYVTYCRRLGLSCELVQGQYEQADYCWNIVQIDGAYYHVDTAACYRDGLEAGFLLDDESAWGAYRWDYFSYPHCTGPLRCADLLRASSAHTDTPQQISDEAEKNP